VPGHEFFFAIDLSDHEASLELCREVVSRLVAQAGFGAGDVSQMTAELQAAVISGMPAPAATCRVTIVAEGGRLEIVVSSSSGQVWQVTHSLA
jgi:hypothetical protein